VRGKAPTVCGRVGHSVLKKRRGLVGLGLVLGKYSTSFFLLLSHTEIIAQRCSALGLIDLTFKH
jgi:hypothetical protein